MCCFSRPVLGVSHTSIFARHLKPGWQGLIYSMQVNAKEPVAMVLPLPVAPGLGEGGLRFVDLSGYAGLFVDMERLFPPPPASRMRSINAVDAMPQTLKVQTVGSFVASYAPTRADMARLDPQFRLPEAAWKALPKVYERYGFAVFQLRAGEHKVHPMALEFASATPDKLFFPTVHVHDGKVHPAAEFDHTLYCQTAGGPPVPAGEAWVKSALNAQDAVNLEQSKGLVAAGLCFKQRLYGHRTNEDTLVMVSTR
jgi:hypothetical protein